MLNLHVTKYEFELQCCNNDRGKNLFQLSMKNGDPVEIS